MRLKVALMWSAFWIGLSLVACALVWAIAGGDAALAWLSCWAVEKLLSLDNMVMFYAIFKFLGVTKKNQRKALNWGIIGAFILRGIILLGGAALIGVAPWVLYICAAFLIFSGVKIFFSKSDDDDNEPNKIINFIKKHFPKISLFFLTIVTIELTDLLFALDSIPAAFGITSNFLILFTSNFAAVLGLRSLYFVLTAAIDKFHFLAKGVSIILTGIGLKMIIPAIISFFVPTFIGLSALATNGVMLGFIAVVVGISVGLSMMKEYAAKPETPQNKGVMRSVCTFFFKPEKEKIVVDNLEDAKRIIQENRSEAIVKIKKEEIKIEKLSKKIDNLNQSKEDKKSWPRLRV